MSCNDIQPVIPSQNLDIRIGNFVDLANNDSDDLRNNGTFTFSPAVSNTEVALVNLIKISGVSANISDMLGFFSRAALTNGVILRVQRENELPFIFATYKTNFDLIFYSNEGATGSLTNSGSSGQTKISAHIHYDPQHNKMTKRDKLEIVTQDDLSSLNIFKACVFYKVVSL